MSFRKEWVKYGLRVFTRNGPGKLISCEEMHGVVRLDKPWAGSRDFYFEEQGEVVLESDFTLVRIINLTSFTPILVTSAQNYWSWGECLSAMEDLYSSNETLLALNFQKRVFESNRKLKGEDLYQILETGLSVYRQHTKDKFYFSLEEARKAWHEDIDVLSGTSSDILLCALLDFENNKILAKAFFATTQVVSKETFW